MEVKEKTTISVHTKINAPIEMVWKYWTTPKDIMKWNNASDDWHTPFATNDLRPGGIFNCRMEAKDGSMGFDFEGVYETVLVNRQLDYVLGDERKVSITFTAKDNNTEMKETFDAESENSLELQRNGWQAILNNFKKYAEESTL